MAICGGWLAAKKSREAAEAIKSHNICMYCEYYNNHSSVCGLKRNYVNPIYYCKNLKRSKYERT